MFTQCPECEVVLELQASNLRDAQAYVRCGQCGAVFNALDTLTDEAGTATENLYQPDQELAPPLLEPERPAEPQANDDRITSSATPDSKSSYADLPGYDFDVEYVSDDDEYGEAGSPPELRVGEAAYHSPTDPDDKVDDEEVATPPHITETPEATSFSDPVTDDVWQQEAVQSLEALGQEDFPEAKPVSTPSTSHFGDVEAASALDDDPPAQEKPRQPITEPDGAVSPVATSDSQALAAPAAQPGPQSVESNPADAQAPSPPAHAEQADHIQTLDESSATIDLAAPESSLEPPGLPENTEHEVSPTSSSDQLGEAGPSTKDAHDPVDDYSAAGSNVSGPTENAQPAASVDWSEAPDATAEPNQEPAPDTTEEVAGESEQDNSNDGEPDREGDWNEVADWLVEFTGGPAEGTSAPADDNTVGMSPEAREPVKAAPADHETSKSGASADTSTDSLSAEVDQTAEQITDVSAEAGVPDASEEENLDEIEDWVLEEEVIEVMADLEPSPKPVETAGDGSYSLTDDIPAQEAPPDLDPDSIVLAPKTATEEEVAIERKPYDLSDEAHLYESDEDAEWLSPKVAGSVTESEPPSRVSTVAWVGGGTLALLLLAGQIIYALAPGAAETSAVRQWARSLCAMVGCSVPLIKDTSKIVMINRSVRPHPGVEGTLLITAIFRNEAAHAQPFPIVEVTLSDLRGQRVGMRRFEPEEYLETGNDIEQGMQPMTLVPVTLEVIEPESEAPDFLFDFY